MQRLLAIFSESLNTKGQHNFASHIRLPRALLESFSGIDWTLLDPEFDTDGCDVVETAHPGSYTEVLMSVHEWSSAR